MAGPGTLSVSGRATDEQELGKLRTQHHWLQVSRMKLLMDLIFVCTSTISPGDSLPCPYTFSAYDVFHLQRFKEPAKAVTGLASAVLRSADLL